MADRYQDRPFPDDGDDDRARDQSGAGRGEGDPLAELARLIGQTDPFGTMGRANAKIPPRASPRDQYPGPAEPDEAPPAGPPPWMQRASRQEIPEQDEPPEYPSAVHPLQRYARAAPEPHYEEEPQYADEPDPSRYDDALYGQIDDGSRQSQHDPAYADEEAYAYQDDYDEAAEEQVPKRGGMATVVVVLALAVLGTGAAFAYRTYVGSPRSGEPPVIKADTSPIKIVPAPSDGSGKVPDRMNAGDGTEKIVPREEAPVDVNAKAGPRVVLAPMNPNGTLPPVASVAPVRHRPPITARCRTLCREMLKSWPCMPTSPTARQCLLRHRHRLRSQSLRRRREQRLLRPCEARRRLPMPAPTRRFRWRRRPASRRRLRNPEPGWLPPIRHRPDRAPPRPAADTWFRSPRS